MLVPISSPPAAEKQLDQLQKIVSATILASVIIILADAGAEKDVSFLGLKTETAGAYGIAAFAFTAANLMVSQLLLRLSDIIKLSEPEDLSKIIGIIFNHNWTFNPFSFFGSSFIATLHAAFGMSSLIFVWSVAMVDRSLYTGFIKLSRFCDAPNEEDIEKIWRGWQRGLKVKCVMASLSAALGGWVFYQFTQIGM